MSAAAVYEYVENVLRQNIAFRPCPIHSNIILQLEEASACENCARPLTPLTRWKYTLHADCDEGYRTTYQLCQLCFVDIAELAWIHVYMKWCLYDHPIIIPRDLYQIILEYLYTTQIKCPFH